MHLIVQVRVELYDVRRTKFIQAHTSALACIALSQDGKMLATASERGTLVRVHSTFDGTKLQVWQRHAHTDGSQSESQTIGFIPGLCSHAGVAKLSLSMSPWDP